MTGDERRRNEINHPETTLTSLEKEKRTTYLTGLLIICNAACLTIMILGSVIVMILTSFYGGITGFTIAFIGILLDVTTGAIIAYHFGNKITTKTQENKI